MIKLVEVLEKGTLDRTDRSDGNGVTDIINSERSLIEQPDTQTATVARSRAARKRDPEMEFTRMTLNNGNKMPPIGLGTYRIRTQDDINVALDAALGAGYRLFDTAAVYRNEHLIADAFATLLPKYDLQREDIFITTKLSPSDHGNVSVVEKAYRKSLERLGTDYVDLFLIHFPGASKLKAQDKENKKIRQTTWAAMQELYDGGHVNAIGVSNFTITHLEELIEKNHSVLPAVNQVEFHPYYNQEELLMFCNQRNIIVQAYSSFGGTSSEVHGLMDDHIIKKIASKHDASSGQVLLAWALQKEIAVIPKSVHPQRIQENISMTFRLTDKDMKDIDGLRHHNTKFAWNPQNVA